VRLSVQLFDELVFTVHYSVLSDVKAIAEPIMKEQETDFLPFDVGLKTGINWREVSE
jgi:DNA polymerase I-like protein with 3'-5' exonuclease and polymerase domains